MTGADKWSAEYPRWPAVRQVQEVFGTWNRALLAACFAPRNQRWSERDSLRAGEGLDSYREGRYGILGLIWATSGELRRVAHPDPVEAVAS